MSIERIRTLSADAGDENPLAKLAAVAELRAELDRYESVAVRQARNAGVGPDGVLAFCSRCEMPLLPGAAFCGNCGTSVLASAHLHGSDQVLVSVAAATSDESGP